MQEQKKTSLHKQPNDKMRTRLLAMMAALLALAGGTQAQTLVDSYAFGTRVDSTAWIDITGVDSVVIAPTTTIYSANSLRTPIGFTFMLGGRACTWFSANVNGTIGLSSSTIYPSGYFNLPLGTSPGGTGYLPKVVPFGWR